MRFAQISNLFFVYPSLALSVLLKSMSYHVRRSHTGKRVQRFRLECSRGGYNYDYIPGYVG